MLDSYKELTLLVTLLDLSKSLSASGAFFDTYIVGPNREFSVYKKRPVSTQYTNHIAFSEHWFKDKDGFWVSKRKRFRTVDEAREFLENLDGLK